MGALTRRSLLIGLGSALAAPAIVRAESLMPVRAVTATEIITSFDSCQKLFLYPWQREIIHIMARKVGKTDLQAAQLEYWIENSIEIKPIPLEASNGQ